MGFVDAATVQIDALCNTTDEALFANIATNSMRDIPWIDAQPSHDRVAVIVGGGPSLAGMVGEIALRAKSGQDVFALNNAAHFLVRHGVIPDYQVILDARAKNVDFVRGYPARSYLLASQCDPALFDYLKGGNVSLFHPAIEGIGDSLPRGRKMCLIGGGITAGLTAMALTFALGYRQMRLYGYDSSDADDGTSHPYAQHETEAEKRRLRVKCAGREFRCSFAMYKQATEFSKFAALLADEGCTIAVHGDGLLPTIAHEMVRDPLSAT